MYVVSCNTSKCVLKNFKKDNFALSAATERLQNPRTKFEPSSTAQ